ncbi:MAG: LysR family transcriptional regulator [Curvibacter sp.]|nr:LysR family transcriptional regulator [Curvibacter sp.]
MNLRQMEVFRAVMLTGSIGGAAQLLHVSAPAVSRLIKHLQSSLDVPLFERQGTGILPTQDARVLYEEVRKIYGGIETVLGVAKSLKTGEGRSLRIVCSPSAGLAAVPEVVAMLGRDKPALSITLDVLPLRVLTQELLTHQADLGIALIEPEHPSLRTRLLGRARLVVAVPAGHLLTSRSTLSLRDLSGQSLIKFDQSTIQGRTMDTLLQEAGVEVRSGPTVRIARVGLALVRAGAGIAVVDELTAASERDATLTFLPLRSPFRYPISLVWNRDRPLSAAGQHVELLARKVLRRILAAQPA